MDWRGENSQLCLVVAAALVWPEYVQLLLFL